MDQRSPSVGVAEYVPILPDDNDDSAGAGAGAGAGEEEEIFGHHDDARKKKNNSRRRRQRSSYDAIVVACCDRDEGDGNSDGLGDASADGLGDDGDRRSSSGGENDPVPVPAYVYLLAGCAALNSVNLGFDIGVNTDAGLLIQQSLNLTDVQLELFMGSINFYALLGALCSSRVASSYGLRLSFILGSVGFIVGLLVQLFSTSYRTLMFGRIFVGLGVGFGLAIGPLFIAEIAPKSHRGYFVSWAEIGCNVGILLGFGSGFLSYALEPDLAWRVMFGMGCVMPAVVAVLAATVMSESPRWLVQKGRDSEARVVLGRLYPQGHNVDAELETIKVAIDEERTVSDRVGWDALLNPTPSVRRMLLVGLGTAVCQQASGIDAIQYYLAFILEEAGITDRLEQAKYLTALGFLKLSCLFIAGPLFDKHGRRKLMFVSLSGITTALFIIASTFFTEQDRSNTVLLGLALYLAFFSVGIGPLAWVIPAEIFSTTIRARAVSATTCVNRLTATVMASSMLSIADAITWGGYFVALGCVCLGILVFFYVYLPETKGRSLEEMSRYFAEITNDASILRLGQQQQPQQQGRPTTTDADEGFEVELITNNGKHEERTV